jgi:hypothetical protein
MATGGKIIRPGAAVTIFAHGFSDSLLLLFSYFGFSPWYYDFVIAVWQAKGHDPAPGVTD